MSGSLSTLTDIVWLYSHTTDIMSMGDSNGIIGSKSNGDCDRLAQATDLMDHFKTVTTLDLLRVSWAIPGWQMAVRNRSCLVTKCEMTDAFQTNPWHACVISYVYEQDMLVASVERI